MLSSSWSYLRVEHLNIQIAVAFIAEIFLELQMSMYFQEKLNIRKNIYGGKTDGKHQKQTNTENEGKQQPCRKIFCLSLFLKFVLTYPS